MVQTMKSEGHSALVHTAAASNLGQMLNRICLQDGVGLVNIVRKQGQVDLLKAQGAKFVCSTESPDFMAELTDAIAATGATIAFDALGGGRLAGQILTCMETALSRNAQVYSRYGSPTHKQVYLYGTLDTAPTEVVRNFGFSWGMGGWLLFLFLQTFASHYAHEVSLAGALQMEAIAVYGKRSTGAKYLINPSL
jgi:NADPH2:quinone reductase